MFPPEFLKVFYQAFMLVVSVPLKHTKPFLLPAMFPNEGICSLRLITGRFPSFPIGFPLRDDAQHLKTVRCD